jgi:hypothetical protein
VGDEAAQPSGFDPVMRPELASALGVVSVAFRTTFTVDALS